MSQLEESFDTTVLEHTDELREQFFEAISSMDPSSIADLVGKLDDEQLWLTMLAARTEDTPAQVEPALWQFLQEELTDAALHRGWRPRAHEDAPSASVTALDFVLLAIERIPTLTSEELSDILVHSRNAAPADVPTSTWNMLRATARQAGTARGLDVTALQGPADSSLTSFARGLRSGALRP